MTGPIRILVVDDHPIVRSGIIGLLGTTSDLKVVGEASTGTEAVELALKLKPDLVLMDLRMPDIDGDEATAIILKQLPDTKVLILTTYDSDESILTAIEAGASGYLLKAAPQEELLAGIRSVASGEVVLAPRIASLLVSRVRRPKSPSLSSRETEILRLVAEGMSNPEIASKLFVAEATVKTHLLHAFEKLEVNDRTRAVTRAMELNIL
ncbi:MAG: response regulator transcription factor [Cryobacterium sp.]|nr:response regulator transcription factor [Cryobacterium sp.]